MEGPPPSLVQYEPPLSVGEDGPGAAASKSRSGAGAGASAKASDAHLDEILNSILPPRMWTQEDSATWMQYVAKDHASRADVITLQEALDQRLMQRQAREMGICPVREDLYSQCFGAWRGVAWRGVLSTSVPFVSFVRV